MKAVINESLLALSMTQIFKSAKDSRTGSNIGMETVHEINKKVATKHGCIFCHKISFFPRDAKTFPLKFRSKYMIFSKKILAKGNIFGKLSSGMAGQMALTGQ